MNSPFKKLLIKNKVTPLAYAGFLSTKSTNNCRKFIYGDGWAGINYTAVNEAIKELDKNKYIISTGHFNKRPGNLIYASSSLPMIEHVKMALANNMKLSNSETKQIDYALSRLEEQALERILDSIWFGDLVDYTAEDYRSSKTGRLHISNTPKFIGKILMELAAINIGFSKNKEIYTKIPTLKDIDLHSDFDNFARMWVKSKKLRSYKGLIEKTIKISSVIWGMQKISKNSKYYKPKKYIDKLTRDRLIHYSQNQYFLCIPQELAYKLFHNGPGIGIRDNTDGTIRDGVSGASEYLSNRQSVKKL